MIDSEGKLQLTPNLLLAWLEAYGQTDQPLIERVLADQANPKNIFDRDSNPFFYDPDELRNIMRPLGSNPSLPGKKN